MRSGTDDFASKEGAVKGATGLSFGKPPLPSICLLVINHQKKL